MRTPSAGTLRRMAWLTAAVVIMVAGAGCGGEKRQDTDLRPVAVRVVKPTTTDLQDKIAYVGTVHAEREIRLSAQVQGTVARLPLAEGARVEPGDLIAELYVPELEANVERLRAEHDYWRQRHETDQRLVAGGALPREQVAASLRARKSTRAALSEAEARLARKTETSPVRGTVLSWLVEPGEHVLPGQPLLLLGSDRLEIHTEVVEEDLRRGIELGLPVEIGNRNGRAFESMVTDVAPMATAPSRTFVAKIPVPPAEAEGLRVGASVPVDFVLASCDDCIAVPVLAIQQDPEGPYLFLIRDGQARKQQVSTGIHSAGLVEVLMPWNGVDPVAISNLSSLADGVPVFAVEVKESRQ